MRIVLYIIGGILTFSGSVWALQGLGVLPGKLMGGKPEWILYGAIAVIVGVTLIVLGNRRKPPRL